MDLEKIKTKWTQFYDKQKKWVWIGGSALALVLLVILILPSVFGGNSEEAQVAYVNVTRGAITESIDVVGTLEAQPMVKLAWESGGIVSPFDLKVGDLVKKGDVLMELEESSLSSAILQAQSDLLDAKAELDNLKSANSALYTASQTLSDAEYTLRQYNTNRDYWNVKGSSWDTTEEARAEYYAAKQIVYEKDNAYKALLNSDDDSKRADAYKEYQDAIAAREKELRDLNNLLGTYYTYAADTDFILYDQAEAAVEEARIDYNRYLDQTDVIAAAEANVQALENTINQSKIIAPFNGTVTDISAVVSQMAASGDAAVRIDNFENLVVKVAVSEVDINKVNVNQKAIVTFDALPNKEYEGEVITISSAGNNDSGVVEFSVTVKVLNSDASVKPGFTAVVSVITSQVENALLAPNGAVVSRNGNSVVMLAGADGSTTPVMVETGASSETFIQIISEEISEGDRLAVFILDNDGGGFGGMNPFGQMRQITGGQGPGRPPQD